MLGTEGQPHIHLTLGAHHIHHLSIQPFLLAPAPLLQDLPPGIQLSLQLGLVILRPHPPGVQVPILLHALHPALACLL